MSDISTKQFLKEFDKTIKRLGGVERAAKYWDMSESFVRSVRSAAHLPGKRILKTMNLKPMKEIKYRYERVDPKTFSDG